MSWDVDGGGVVFDCAYRLFLPAHPTLPFTLTRTYFFIAFPK